MRGGRPGVVVGVDGSDGGRIALGWAAGHARANGLDCVALCAVEFPFISTSRYFVEALADLSDGRQAMLDAEVALVGAAGVEARVTVGQAVDVLVEASRTAALLVVGTGGGPPGSLGPVASGCVRRAHCPVLVARPAEAIPSIRQARVAASGYRPGRRVAAG
ncbi:MAG TPA: universal stress protein [Acidimicrobiales bacterium]|nr:universal stress protein [Acidimicrobiales bacterium]